MKKYLIKANALIANRSNELKTIAERVEHRYDASQEMAYHIFNRRYFYTHGFLDSLQKDFRLFDSISYLGPMLLMTKEKMV